jgi:peptide/nickel transport system permease protein
MASLTPGHVVAPPDEFATRKAARFNRFDSPWLNPKLLVGSGMVLAVLLLGLLGPLVWDTKLARVGSSPLNLPPAWLAGGEAAHPLGTENSGRDMLALLISGAPASLRVGFIAAGVGITIGILLGFTAGFVGGWVDTLIRVIADAAITIPSLAVLIVIGAVVHQIDVNTMALLLALFAWPAPTRIIRAQVLTLRERGYIRMARLSGASTFSIMFREMLPNMLPYLASSFVGNISGAILAATSLEALGLGPQRIPTLGMTIFYSIRASAVLRGMWWWWGFPILMLIIIFTGLFLIATGLDEVANPRLRGAQQA